MTRRIGHRAGLVLTLVAAMALSGCAFLTRSSVGPTGSEQRTQFSEQPAISSNGRFTVFVSAGQVFVRDKATNVTEYVGDGGTPSISNDGRFVAFSSPPSGPFDPDPGTTIVDRTTSAVRSKGCAGGRISGDGHHLAYTCVGEAQDLGHTFFFATGPYLMNLDTGAVAGAFAPSSGQLPLPTVTSFQISDDGSTVMYGVGTVPAGFSPTGIGFGHADGSSTFTSLTGAIAVSGDGTRFAVATPDEPAAGSTTIRIGATSAPTTYLSTYVSSPATWLSLSTDGSLLGAVATIDGVQVAARRAADGSDAWRIVSRTANDARIAAVTDAVMSPEGRWFAFASDDAGLVSDDTNGVRDVFTRSVDHIGDPPSA